MSQRGCSLFPNFVQPTNSYAGGKYFIIIPVTLIKKGHQLSLPAQCKNYHSITVNFCLRGRKKTFKKKAQTFSFFWSQDLQKQQKVILLLKAALCPERGIVPKDEEQLCLHRISLCPWVMCRRAALPSESFTVSMVTVQKDSSAFTGLHCVYGFCAGQLCLCRIALCSWILCRRTALPL